MPQAMDETIRVMLIEDNREYRDVMSLGLEGVSDIELVQQNSTAEIALRKLEYQPSVHVDIILLDLRLPGMSGLDAIPFITHAAPRAKIIILTQSEHEVDVLKAISLGARGYLLKSASMEEIISSIRTVMSGGAPIDPSVARYLLEDLQTRSPEINLKINLSSRETEILHLLGDGLVKKEIAEKLSIGYTTVDTHVRHIYEKLHVTNAASAVSKAYKMRISPKDKS